MKTKLPLLLLFPFLLAASPPTSTSTPALPSSSQPATAPATQPTAQTDTPDHALRSFLRAMFLHDAKLGNAVTLPADGSAILYQGKSMSMIQTAMVLNYADTVAIKHFAVGDKFTLPDRQHHVITFDENYINDDRQQLLPEDAAFPFTLERQSDGSWRVDPGAMIAARRAVAKARAAAASQPATQPASKP
jgi:hypothetical protein